MAITTPGLFMVEANVGNCGLLACTKKSWANKVRETANDIAKCAGEDKLLTGRFRSRLLSPYTMILAGVPFAGAARSPRMSLGGIVMSGRAPADQGLFSELR
jgi:hypothetical protein